MENLEVKEEETFYGNRRGKWSKYSKNRPGRSDSPTNYHRYNSYKYSSYGKPKNNKGRNPLDEYGKITRCSLCESVNHYKKDCPDKEFVEHETFHEEYHNDSDDENESLAYEIETHSVNVNRNSTDLTKIVYSCESFNAAILDSGAPKSVCGTVWLNQYVDSLSKEDKLKISQSPTTSIYKFGCGSKTQAIKRVKFPAMIGKINVMLKADVVDGELPLLLSKDCMKRTKSELNFKNDTITILDQTLNLLATRSGHYALPLGKDKEIFTGSSKNPEIKLTLHANHSNLDDMCSDDEIEIFKTSAGLPSVKESRVKVNSYYSPVDVKLDSPGSSIANNFSSPYSYSSHSSHNSLSTSDFCNEGSVSLSECNSSDLCNNSSFRSPQCGSDSTIYPIFISDGITGDLNSNNIISKCFPGETYQSILDQVIKSCSLNTDIWLSIGNFLPLLADAPYSAFEHTSKRSDYRNAILVSFRDTLVSFEKSVRQSGGRVFLAEVFPSPRALNPDPSKVPDNFQKLSWDVYLGLNDVIHDLNRQFGHTRTLNFNSYLRHRISIRKGKVKSFNKSVMEISCEDEERGGPGKERRRESKLKEGLHHSNGFNLLEPSRQVIVHVASRAILNSFDKRSGRLITSH